MTGALHFSYNYSRVDISDSDAIVASFYSIQIFVYMHGQLPLLRKVEISIVRFFTKDRL